MGNEQLETPLDRLGSALSKEGAAQRSTLRDRISRFVDKQQIQIKVLEILPSKPGNGELIVCTLRRQRLQSRRPYTALSYVWGDPRPTSSIEIDGRQVPITANLAEALGYLRGRPMYARALWIDALCIDQKNAEEVNQQVQVMDVIYRKARWVVAWLGPADSASKRTFEVMRKASDMALGLVKDTAPSVMERGATREEARNVLLGSSIGGMEDLNLIVKLLLRPYWSRLWIIQEISLAKDATLICGECDIPWKRAADAFTLMSWAHPPAFTELLPPAAWLTARITAAGKPELDLYELFSYTCDGTRLQALKPNDRIYAILGLLPPATRRAITVDYTQTPTILFAAMTRYSLETYGADLLMFCGLAYRSALQPDLPTWALDWTSTVLRSENIFTAACSFGRLAPLPCRLTPRGADKIGIRGTRISQVAAVVVCPGAEDDALNVVEQLEPFAQTLGITLDALRQRVVVALIYGFSDIVNQKLVSATMLEEIADGDRAVGTVLWNTVPRSLFITDLGHIGSGPTMTRVGDVVHAFADCRTLFLLRCEEGGAGWQLVGPAYVEGITTFGGRYHRHMQAFWDSGPAMEEVVLC